MRFKKGSLEIEAAFFGFMNLKKVIFDKRYYRAITNLG